MNNKKYKNVVAPVPMDIYNKLVYICSVTGLTMPELMRNILDNDFFRVGVDETFKLMAKLPDK